MGKAETARDHHDLIHPSDHHLQIWLTILNSPLLLHRMLLLLLTLYHHLIITMVYQVVVATAVYLPSS
jgi:hypothetical protein